MRAPAPQATPGRCCIVFFSERFGWRSRFAAPPISPAAQCREIDILISSTSAEEPLLTRELLAPMLRGRADRPLFIIDIAVPRDVAPEVNEMDGVYLYDIDSLQSIAEQSLAMRREQMAAAEKIIADHVQDFSTRFGGGDNPAPSLSPGALASES